MTHLQAITTMREGLLSQDGPSMTAFGDGCAYRGIGKRKCAVGWLIPDEKYEPEMEGSLCAIRQRYVGAIPEELDVNFLNEAQLIHDRFPRGGKDEEWGEYITDEFDSLEAKWCTA